MPSRAARVCPEEGLAVFYTGMTPELKRFLPATTVLIVIVAAAVATASIQEEPPRVHPLFELSARSASPFPSDMFTVADSDQATGRRVNLPYPDCAARPSDCQDLNHINTLDGFGLQTRISIPFDGRINPRRCRQAMCSSSAGPARVTGARQAAR
jgi:hypothetical protein